MSNTLTPSYLEIDYDTLISRLTTQLKNSDVFTDLAYEGSNIRTLVELLAYIGELNLFFINRTAKNMFEETADIFETAHSLAKQKGYDVKGPRSSKATLTVIIDTTKTKLSDGDQLIVSPWSQLRCSSDVQYDSKVIEFATTYDIADNSDPNYTVTVATSAFKTTNSLGVSGSWFEFEIPVRQGTVKTYSSLYGRDINDYQLLLPLLDFAYDDDLNDYNPSIQLTVNDDSWIRVGDFYDEISGLEGENTKIYKLEYDKYRRNKIVFSSAREVPSDTDEITIKLLETLGANGNVGANKITTIVDPTTFIWNSNGGDSGTGAYIDKSAISITNLEASSGGAAAEILSQIRENSREKQHAQYRNVTSRDYIAHLKERSDVVAANVWGEQQVAPSGGDTREYNKVYISIIPDVWNAKTIYANSEVLVRNTGSASLSATITTPVSASSTFENTIYKYLEPRKILTSYEQFVVPKLVYFFFDIELRVKQTYNFADVQTDVLAKLVYYFNATNRQFGETIDFFDIAEYIRDPLYVSDSDSFSNIKGIETIEFRDIDSNMVIYEPNVSTDPRKYPQYTVEASHWSGDNKLRRIKLDYDQFPQLARNLCRFFVA